MSSAIGCNTDNLEMELLQGTRDRRVDCEVEISVSPV
jgi:hypothetical protein